MDMALKGLLALFWLLVVPTAAGNLFFRKKQVRTLSECFLAGYLLLFAAAEILILPMVFLQIRFHILVWCWGITTGIAALLGLGTLRRSAFPSVSKIRTQLRTASPFFWCALILIAVQICIVALYAHFDADDAFYVATATTTVKTDTLFQVNPYTGMNYRKLPSRYVLSPFPIFLAVISQLCGGLHPAITAHTIFPPVFQILAYTAVYQLARRWFEDSGHGRGIFLFTVAALNSFASYSVYNAGSFQMVRLWQGKALLAAALLPLLLYLCLSNIMEEKPEYPWSLLLAANIACCLLSSMGIILAPLMQGCFVMLSLLHFRTTGRALRGLACCIPSLLLGGLYLLVF